VHALNLGDLVLVPLALGEKAEAHLEPGKGMDLGAGRGKPVTRTLVGGVVGVLLDARGRRPFVLPQDARRRIETLVRWNEAVDMYPRKTREAVGV